MEPGNLEALLRCLLPTAPVPTPPPQPIPMELLLECLRSGAPAQTPTSLPQTGITGMETLLQRLLPGTPVPAPQADRFVLPVDTYHRGSGCEEHVCLTIPYHNWPCPIWKFWLSQVFSLMYLDRLFICQRLLSAG